ncbi:hypothetical protein BDR06DRAFT_968245 [Suillus hirtellus]|nr:hypothetical protein BDR06DRAFT_968245 [Suillus hirtellus]
MSTKYLQQTYDDFASAVGTCHIIHTTAGASMYGIPKNMSEAAQRDGCAAQDGNLCGLYLIMVETWALEVELMEEHNDDSDLDKPYAAMLKKNLSKKDQTGLCSV